MDTIEDFLASYETTTREMTIHGRRYTFRVPLDIDRFIEADDPLQHFPLWARIWKASWIMADHLARMPVAAGGSILEIGAGLGVASIVASSLGHRVTMTEYDAHALAFARANAAINGCDDLRIARLDWHAPDFKERFDTIVGSEVLYHERDFDALMHLFTNYLNTTGRVFLSMKPRRSALAFFNRAQKKFKISMKKIGMKAQDEDSQIFLCRMVRRENA
ncbi:MAG: methyltransferase [Deltaproteobacteria bacterium]|nr:methyltransferase [Deltaproteobacteria bacterium]